jgi:hypothetical protein
MHPSTLFRYYLQVLDIKKKESDRAPVPDVGLELRDLWISKVCAVGDCCSSHAGGSEADLMIERFKDYHFLTNLLFSGVDDPA